MADQVDGPKKKDSLPGAASRRPKSRRRRRLNEWQDLISEQLDEAAANGAFENLPGKGQPLRLDRFPNEPDDMRMANKLLKDNDLTPTWIGDRKALLAEIELLRTEMKRQWELTRACAGAAGSEREAFARSWRRSIADWEANIDELNRRIVSLNIALPIWRMELHRLRLDEELKRIGASNWDGESPL
ncbi:MAG: DUF1992 domain-containing protein [Caldilineaceae bacterium SB0665_bin_25]|nr:DUF1992 domain-containing protein [Caldilineaceae bacterium]MXZ20159.1 DUF1992 domain-containing protein [Caldilineaceae bacterium SB0665_bin_25]